MNRGLLVAIALVAMGICAWLWLLPRRTPEVARPTTAPPRDAASQANGASRARPPEPGTAAARPVAAATARVVAAWGDGPFDIGRQHDPESEAEGPHALAVDGKGRILIVDQLHRRILRFGPDGKPDRAIKLPSATVDDLVLPRDGSLAVLDRLAEKSVWLVDDNGQVRGEAPIEGKGVREAGGTTGLFVDEKGDLYVEYEHSSLVQVATATGQAGTRGSLPGRPRRDGGVYLRGAIADRAAGIVRLDALERSGAVLWTVNLPLGAPVLYIDLVDSDRSGRSYVAAHVGHEDTQPPYRVVDDTLVIIAIDAQGTPVGSLRLPSTPSGEEAFRELTIGDDGTIYRMVRTDRGVTVESYRL